MKDLALQCSRGRRLLAAASAQADEWFPYDAAKIEPPFAADGKSVDVSYVPLEKASKPWNICVSFPHMKDAYWLGVDYGVAEEAKRLGVKMNLVDAGGYTELNKQISQIEDCVASGAQAVVIGAISVRRPQQSRRRDHKKDIPVIDVINGISSPDVTAKSLVSFYTMGSSTGEYLAKKHPAGTRRSPGRLVPRTGRRRLGRGCQQGLHGRREGFGDQGPRCRSSATPARKCSSSSSRTSCRPIRTSATSPAPR